MANTEGSKKPYGVMNVTGIRVRKYMTNIVGQKASEKLNPKKNAPKGVVCFVAFDFFHK